MNRGLGDLQRRGGASDGPGVRGRLDPGPVRVSPDRHCWDDPRYGSHLIARQILPSRIPHHARDDALVVRARIENLKLGAIAKEERSQTMLCGKLRDVLAAHGFELVD